MSDAAAHPLYVYAVLSKELVDPAKSVQAATGERPATAHDYDAPNQPPCAADPAQRPVAWQGGGHERVRRP